MHVHVEYRNENDYRAEHRAKLLELAARRGEKGFSSVIAEAIDSYLAGGADQDLVRRRALKLRGALPKAKGERLRRDIAAMRAFWR